MLFEITEAVLRVHTHSRLTQITYLIQDSLVGHARYPRAVGVCLSVCRAG